MRNVPQFKLDEQKKIWNYREDFLHVDNYFYFAKELIEKMPCKDSDGKPIIYKAQDVINLLFSLSEKYGILIHNNNFKYVPLLKAIFRVSLEKTIEGQFDAKFKFSLNTEGFEIQHLTEPKKRGRSFCPPSSWLRPEID